MEFYFGILAGGKSERFGSNKAIFKIDGISLISRLLLVIPKLIVKPKIIYISLHTKEQLPEIIGAIKNDLNAVKIEKLTWELPSYENDLQNNIPIKIIFDYKRKEHRDIQAAIFGLYAIFREISEGFIQIVPCDTPDFKAKNVNALLSIYKDSDWQLDALIPRWRNGYVELLHGIYRVDKFIDRVETNIDKKIFRLKYLLDEGLSIKYFEIEEKLAKIDPTFKSFKNINTKEDLS